MGVRKATGFLTSDGKFFGPQDEAKANEHELMARLTKFCDNLYIGHETLSKKLAEALFDRREELVRILNGLDEPTVREEVYGK